MSSDAQILALCIEEALDRLIVGANLVFEIRMMLNEEHQEAVGWLGNKLRGDVTAIRDDIQRLRDMI